jgi:hypothetical protein
MPHNIHMLNKSPSVKITPCDTWMGVGILLQEKVHISKFACPARLILKVTTGDGVKPEVCIISVPKIFGNLAPYPTLRDKIYYP